ncbi:MAG: sigma-70 family RNA polymerase sigma factor [Ignavibacteriae bacterium]|nr:sigma-70 family RNA polymerase sigma factor [Ignavibacteriota bacterium]
MTMVSNLELKVLLKENEKYIFSIVKEFDLNVLNKNDLLSAARLGFYNAYKKYNQNADSSLMTYAYDYIKGEILKQQNEIINSQFSDIDVRNYSKLNNFMSKNYRDYDSEIDFSSIEEETVLDMEKRLFLLNFNNSIIKLDEDSKKDSDFSKSTHGIIEQKFFKSRSYDCEIFFLNKEILKRLELLTPNEKEVVMLYYGFNSTAKYNLVEISQRLHLGSTRVSQLLYNSYRKLRKDPIMRQLYVEQFYEGYYYGYEFDSFIVNN